MNKNKTYKDENCRNDAGKYFSPGSPGNGNPFFVPEGYFEELPARIMQRVAENGKKGLVDHLSLFFRKPVYYIPSALFGAVLLLMAVFFYSGNGDQADEQLQLTWYDVISTVPELAYTLDDASLMEIFLDDNLQALSGTELDLDDVFETGLTEDAIIYYLQDQNVSSELLYEL